MKKWIYKKAFRFILDQHSQWLSSDGREGTRLNFSGKNLSKAVFHATRFYQAEFLAAFFRNAVFTRADMQEANLSRCKMAHANFSGTIINMTNNPDFVDTMMVYATPDGSALVSKRTDENDDFIIDPNLRTHFIQENSCSQHNPHTDSPFETNSPKS